MKIKEKRKCVMCVNIFRVLATSRRKTCSYECSREYQVSTENRARQKEYRKRPEYKAKRRECMERYNKKLKQLGVSRLGMPITRKCHKCGLGLSETEIRVMVKGKHRKYYHQECWDKLQY